MLWVNSFLRAALLNNQMFFFDLGLLTSMSWFFLPHSLSSSPANLIPLSSLVKDRPNNTRMGFEHLILLMHVRKCELDLFDACLWVTTQERLQFCLVGFFFLNSSDFFPFNQHLVIFFCLFVPLLLVLFVLWGDMYICLLNQRGPPMGVCGDATSDFKGL